MAGVLPPAIRPAHCEEQLCDRENEGELLVPGTHRANLSSKVIINVIIMNHEHHDNNDDGRPNESFESPRKSRDCWSSGWGADSYEETVSYIIAIIVIMVLKWWSSILRTTMIMMPMNHPKYKCECKKYKYHRLCTAMDWERWNCQLFQGMSVKRGLAAQIGVWRWRWRWPWPWPWGWPWPWPWRSMRQVCRKGIPAAWVLDVYRWH